jgi:predicted RNA binding protein YcfA (HicA-like mRNA interferase family)
MTRLPMVSGRECVKALQRAGFRVIRQSGSHIIMQRQEPSAMVVVPNHDELDRGTLKAILRQADISPDTFIDLL